MLIKVSIFSLIIAHTPSEIGPLPWARPYSSRQGAEVQEERKNKKGKRHNVSYLQLRVSKWS